MVQVRKKRPAYLKLNQSTKLKGNYKMNINNCLQAKFNNLTDANEWIDKKIQSKKWINGKITNGIVQAPGGENVLMYFASVNHSILINRKFIEI